MFVKYQANKSDSLNLKENANKTPRSNRNIEPRKSNQAKLVSQLNKNNSNKKPFGNITYKNPNNKPSNVVPKTSNSTYKPVKENERKINLKEIKTSAHSIINYYLTFNISNRITRSSKQRSTNEGKL